VGRAQSEARQDQFAHGRSRSERPRRLPLRIGVFLRTQLRAAHGSERGPPRAAPIRLAALPSATAVGANGERFRTFELSLLIRQDLLGFTNSQKISWGENSSRYRGVKTPAVVANANSHLGNFVNLAPA